MKRGVLVFLLLLSALLLNKWSVEQLITFDGHLENPLYLGGIGLLQALLLLGAVRELRGRPIPAGRLALWILPLLCLLGGWGAVRALQVPDWQSPGMAMTERLAVVATHNTMNKLEAARRTPREGLLRALRAAYELTGLPEPATMTEARIRDADLAVQRGDTREALRILERIRRLRAHHQEPWTVLDEGVRDRIAMAYLRIGEQDNCIARHTPYMCYLPLPEQGIYTLGDGSRAAIREFEQVLKDHPDDLSSMWLLNLAYMTLGKYPQEVPEQWRIPPERFASEQPQASFEDDAAKLGVDVEGISGSSILDDFNRDGHLDLVVSSTGLADQLRYFEGSADGHFTERTAEAGLNGQFGGLNITHADYDNDGYLDVLVLRGAWMLFDNGSGNLPNSLLHNNGDGTFTDVTERVGLLSFHPTQVGMWADYDNDGWLDLFIGNESSSKQVHPAELYHNNGDGTFTERAAAAGVAVLGMVKGAAWGDIDNDGLPDLYVSRLGQPNVLYHNDGAASGWTFSDVTAKAGVAEPLFSFPTWFWDYDNDGWQDLFVAGFSGAYPQPTGYDEGGNESHLPYDDAAAPYWGRPIKYSDTPRLYRNNRDGTFSDVSKAVGLDRYVLVMGGNFGDIDNDGYLDIYLGTGSASYRSLMPNVLLRSDAGKRFLDVTTAARVGHLQKGHGISFGDFDNDGDEDIYAVLGGWYTGDLFRNALYRNPGNGNGWVTLRLRGVQSNRAAIGTRVKLVLDTPAGPRVLHRTVSAGGSFGNSSLQLEIGLGDASAIERVEVTWPRSGAVQTIARPPLREVVEIEEPGPARERDGA